MATYLNDLRLSELATGEGSGTWGVTTNTNLELIGEALGYGTKQMAADADETFTMPDASADGSRALYLKITSAVSLTTTRVVTLGPNTVSKFWIIENATSGSQDITIKQGSGATVNVPNGNKVYLYTDGAGAGAAVANAEPSSASGGTVTSVGGTGTVNGITLTGTVTSSGNLTLGGSLSNVDLTSQVTGTLPIANGGTGTTSTTFVDLTTNVTGTLPYANGGTGLSSLGTANQVIGVNAGGTALEFQTVSGGTNIFTAASAISAGDAVALRSDGDVEPITGYKTSLGFEKQGLFNNLSLAVGYNDAAQDPNTNIVVRVYAASSGTFAKAYTVAADGTVTEGTEVSLGFQVLDPGPRVFWDATNSNFVLFYRRSGVVAVRSLSVNSGTLAVTVGTEQDKTSGLNANAGFNCTMGYDSDADQYFALFRDATSGYAQGAYGTWDGSDLTFGTAAQIYGVASNQFDVTYVPEETRMLCHIGTAGSSGVVAVLNSSGTPVAGSIAQLQTTYQNFYPKIAWNGSKAVMAEQVNGNTFLYIATLTGSTVTITGTQLWVNSSIYSHCFVVSPSNDVYYFRAQTSFDFYELDLSGSKPTYKNKVDIALDGATNYQSTWGFTWLSNINGIDMVYLGAGLASGTGNRQSLYYTGAESTNAHRFVGVATANISSAASGSITTTGGVNTAVSGLTTGEDYFVQADGTITTDSSQYGLVGKATSATSLYLNPSKNVNLEELVAASGITQGLPVRLNANGEIEVISGTHAFANTDDNQEVFTLESEYVSFIKVPETDIYVIQYRGYMKAVRVEANGTFTVGTQLTLNDFDAGNLRGRMSWNSVFDQVLLAGRGNSSANYYCTVAAYDLNQTTLALSVASSLFLDTSGSAPWVTGLIAVDEGYHFVWFGEGGSGYARYRIIKCTSSSNISAGTTYNPSISVQQNEGSIGYSAKHNVIFVVYRGPTSGRYGFWQGQRTGTYSANQLKNNTSFFYNYDNVPPVPYVDDDNDVLLMCNTYNANFAYHFYDVTAAGAGPVDQQDGTAISLGFSSASDYNLHFGYNPVTGTIQAVIPSQGATYNTYLLDFAYDGAAKTLTKNSETLIWYQWPSLYERRRMREYSQNGQSLPFNSTQGKFYTMTNTDINRSDDTYLFSFSPEADLATTTNFVGFAAEDITAAASGSVYVNGSYLNSPAQLTAGTDVYFDGLGKLSNTVRGAKIGKTSTTTKLVLG